MWLILNVPQTTVRGDRTHSSSSHFTSPQQQSLCVDLQLERRTAAPSSDGSRRRVSSLRIITEPRGPSLRRICTKAVRAARDERFLMPCVLQPAEPPQHEGLRGVGAVWK